MSKKKTKDDGTPKERKKRYYISRKELDIEGYKQELLEKSPSALLARAAHALKASRQFRLYVALQLLAALAGYGQVFFCVGFLWMFYVNTGTRRAGEKSAYSVFNEGVEAIEGATQMEYLERELRRQIY